MNYELEQRVRSDLRGDEKLLWTGQPAQGFRFRAIDLFAIPFSLMWAGGACYWEWTVLHTKAPGFFPIFGAPFVLFGLYLVLGRFFVDAAMRANTYYALTSERAIILSGVLNRQLKSVSLRNLSDVSLREGRSGEGTIMLGAMNSYSARFVPPGWPGAGRYMPPAFDLIENARHVYDLLQSAGRGA